MKEVAKVELSFAEFRALVRLMALEMAACLPASVPLSVDDALMDNVGEVAKEVWLTMKGVAHE